MRFAVLCLAVLPAFCDGPAERQIRVQPTDTIIPQIVDGGAWKTRITLVNLSDQSASYRLSFFGDDGAILPFKVNGKHGGDFPLGSVWIITGSILPRASHVWETAAGLTAANKQGWAELSATPTGSIGGMATLIAESNPPYDFYPLSEAVVPISAANDTRMKLPFDNTDGYVSSYAIANPTQAEVTITLIAYALEANEWGTWQFTMPARSHTAFATVPNANLAFMAGKIGTIELRTSGTGLAALGLRFNPRGAFTSFHALSLPTWIAP